MNAHTHMYSALAPYGMPPAEPPPENFVQILERVWWRLDRALDERSLRISARLYAAESLLYGTTTLIDHHESPNLIEGSLDVLADACEEFGMRAVLCFGATDRNGGGEEGQRGLEECRRFIRVNRRPLVKGMVGLHASFTCSDETLREAGRLARELGAATHVHVAEDRADVEDARKRGYEGPFERLLATEALPAGSIMAHGVHLEPSQVRIAESCGVWLVQNPRSNEGNRVGYASSLWASGKVALGTDGWESDMPKELAALERLAAGSVHEELDAAARRLVTGRVLAAECFRDVPGGAGPETDVVIYSAPGGGEPAKVSRVTVAGRVVVDQGKLVRGDIEALRAEAKEEAQRLWPRMKAL
ncbi:MAG TPA: amidohydrolase family protein [Terriglobales bacterium]|nr:amidohydrolase family protein [Terriglobales bacterium]